MTAANALATAAERGFPAVVNALEASEQAWTLLRVNDSGSELCALVEPPGERLDALLRREGFVPFRDPNGSGQTVHVAYDEAQDTWTWVRLCGRIPVGPRGERGASLTRSLLARSEPLDGVRVLMPVDAFWYGVLELMVGPGSTRPDVDALAALSDAAAAPSPLREEVAASEPTLPGRIMSAAAGGDTAALRNLLRTLVESTHGSRRKPGGEDDARAEGRLRMRGRGLTIAVIGPDGAGKTTLARGLVESLPLETRYVYLGMWQRSRLRRLVAPIPFVRFALVVAQLAVRSSRIAAHRRLGRVVVVDRFTYDADVPSATADWKGRTSAKILKRLAREPEIAILLDARPEVMFARKGEHDPTRLEELRDSYLRMAQSKPRLAVLDAGEPPESVRRKATALVWERLRSADADAQRQVRRR